MRIGILGGSSDPIHFGHLRSAEEVREAFALDRVVFVPANHPPHKPERRLADGRHRLAMIEHAIADNPSFDASTIELDRGGTSYSIDTLDALARTEPDAVLHFIVGIDTFREMQTWKEAARLFEVASVVVTSRPPRDVERSIDHLPVAAQQAFCYDSTTLSYGHRSGTRLHFLPITGIDVSATLVREHVARGKSVRYVVPASVERYIREHDLYRSGEPIG